ncbi:MAG: hypothetical protein ACTHL1_09530 [Burkholderiaceae bacterium]
MQFTFEIKIEAASAADALETLKQGIGSMIEKSGLAGGQALGVLYDSQLSEGWEREPVVITAMLGADS